MAKVLRVVKYFVAIGLFLFIAFMGLGWYMHSSEVDARKNSLVIQRLDRAERDNGDVLKLLVDGMKNANNDDAKLVTEWLKQRQHRGEQPYLYLIGFYYGMQNDRRKKIQGLDYLAKASLVYRIDAAKCGDSTANQAVPILESALGINLVRDNLKSKPEIRQKIIKSALEYEEQNKDRHLPKWICSHGMSQGSPPLGEEAWNEHRQKMRAQFESSF